MIACARVHFGWCGTSTDVQIQRALALPRHGTGNVRPGGRGPGSIRSARHVRHAEVEATRVELEALDVARLLLVVDETHGASSTMICGAFR